MTLSAPAWKAGILWRAAAPSDPAPVRLEPVFAALDDAGITPHRVPYSEERHDAVRQALLALDAVLVWVDPISGGRDRRDLDALLRDIAAHGVLASAHPDVIAAMGTKEVLYRTRTLGWGSEVALYRTSAALESELPGRLSSSGPRVLKPLRGNGGIGVLKVALVTRAVADERTVVSVQHAEHRTDASEQLTLAEFVARMAGSFDDGGAIVDQPFAPRIAEGMVRCYVAGNEVVGFARQYADPAIAPEQVLGLPSAKTMLPPDEPSLRALRTAMEGAWLPGLQHLVDVPPDRLPAVWDADFLYGPTDAAGADTYVLCEINCSCVTPFPPEAPARIAAWVRKQLRRPR